MSAEDFWIVRERIYEHLNQFICFSLRRWSGVERNRFTGGLDALHDTGEALLSLSKGLPQTEAAAKLAAYGFLQALYVQGDAVAEMETALKIPKKSLGQADVAEIRDIRNRLVGHPARRERGKARPSTGIISLMRTAGGLNLQGGIYYDDGFEVVTIDAHDYIRRMQIGLTPALIAVEVEMRSREEAFRATERQHPLIGLLDFDYTYSLGKISSAARDPDRLSLALSELSMMMNHLGRVRENLAHRDFLSDGPRWSLDTATGAAQLLTRLAVEAEGDRVPENQWDAIVAGLRSAVDDLRERLQSWDDEIAQATQL